MAILYERYTTGDDAVKEIYGDNWRAQSFTVGNTGNNEKHTITSVEVLIYKVGSPPAALDAIIRAVDADGKPTGSNLSTGSKAESDVNTEPEQWNTIAMSAYELQPNTKYALILKQTGGNVSNSYKWRYDTANATYGGGWALYSTNSGDTWSSTTDADFLFKIYGTSGDLPSASNVIAMLINKLTRGC